MNKDFWESVVGCLSKYHPGWVLVIAIGAILAWRTPEIIQALTH
jgi:hypothetical protein